MIKSVSEIYLAIGENMKNNVSGDWKEAILDIEIIEGVVGYKGGFKDQKDSFTSFPIRNFDRELRNDIRELHKITTMGGNNRWNRAIFKLWPNNKFEMEFIWDQELQDEIEMLSK